MKKILLILFCCVSFSGCVSSAKYHVTESEPKQSESYNGITVTCEFLNEGQLKELYGNKDNPFLSPDMTVTPWYILVFEVSIKNETNKMLKYDSREVNLYFGEKASRPMGENDMEDKINEYPNDGSILKQKRVARATMYKNIQRVLPGDNVKRYVVFMNNFREKGDVELQIPLLNDGGGVEEEFVFNYSMIKKRTK